MDTIKRVEKYPNQKFPPNPKQNSEAANEHCTSHLQLRDELKASNHLFFKNSASNFKLQEITKAKLSRLLKH